MQTILAAARAALVGLAGLSAGAAPLCAKETLLNAALGSSDNWSVSGSARVRIEAIDDQFRPAPAAASDQLLSFRTMLAVEYHDSALAIGAELIDARGYAQEPGSSAGTTEINAFELSQVYVTLGLGGGKRAPRLTVGRFTMDEGARRLVARNQFRNTINAFTGARLDWNSGAGERLRLFWTMPHVRLPADVDGLDANGVEWDRESPDLQLFGGSLTKALARRGGTVQLYGYGLTERDAPGYATRNRRLGTFGARVHRAPAAGKIDVDVEAAYQLGESRASTAASDVTDLDVAAGFVHVEVGRSFGGPLAPRLALSYDYASGDTADPRSNGRFDTLFGARRGEYGPTSLFGAVARANLSSPSIRLEVRPGNRTDAFIAWRPLWLASATDSFSGTGVRDAQGTSGRFAGNQVEGRLRHWLMPDVVRLDTGAALLVKGRFLREAPNAPATGDTVYGYADLTFSF